MQVLSEPLAVSPQRPSTTAPWGYFLVVLGMASVARLSIRPTSTSFLSVRFAAARCRA